MRGGEKIGMRETARIYIMETSEKKIKKALIVGRIERKEEMK